MKKYILGLIVVMVCACAVSGYSSKLEEKLFFNHGFFGATFLYQTYFTIGMASDAWTNSSYTPENAKTILQTSSNLLDVALKNLNELIQFPMLDDDRNTFQQMIAIAQDLKNQSSFMIQYINSRNQQDLDKYESHRQEAWKKICVLMDIK